jgi:hypothetical protein
MALIPTLSEQDGYWVNVLSTYPVGPGGGPNYLPWDYRTKSKPTAEQEQETFSRLKARWDHIAAELAPFTAPHRFSGRKRRQLLVSVWGNHPAPWGTWQKRSALESERRRFTAFRQGINEVIAPPHHVDHVVFLERPESRPIKEAMETPI